VYEYFSDFENVAVVAVCVVSASSFGKIIVGTSLAHQNFKSSGFAYFLGIWLLVGSIFSDETDSEEMTMIVCARQSIFVSPPLIVSFNSIPSVAKFSPPPSYLAA
jgi:hypothetical protein